MVQRLRVPTVTDRRGNLSSLQAGVDVPFDIARVYYLHDVPFGAERGGHAHRRLEQAIIVLSGRLVLRTHDGSGWSETEMVDPTEAVLIPRLTWRELDRFSSGAVCMVLASRPYEEDDYIRDFDRFLAEVRR
jgi:dTDP-4-dehydrorhamnose 3,5-epimerase-like enzyme